MNNGDIALAIYMSSATALMATGHAPWGWILLFASLWHIYQSRPKP